MYPAAPRTCGSLQRVVGDFVAEGFCGDVVQIVGDLVVEIVGSLIHAMILSLAVPTSLAARHL
jgi:hypothetical protein